MITYEQALDKLKKEKIKPTIVKEYKDKYWFIIEPEGDKSDPFYRVMNVIVHKNDGKMEYPSFLDVLSEKQKPIKEMKV